MKIDSKKLYQLLSKIPKGKVTTYKELANKLNTKAYRGIGKVVGLNPDAPKVPCHRVVRTDGGLGGYAFGLDKKVKLLKSEGVEVNSGKITDFDNKLYRY